MKRLRLIVSTSNTVCSGRHSSRTTTLPFGFKQRRSTASAGDKTSAPTPRATTAKTTSLRRMVPPVRKFDALYTQGRCHPERARNIPEIFARLANGVAKHCRINVLVTQRCVNFCRRLHSAVSRPSDPPASRCASRPLRRGGQNGDKDRNGVSGDDR